MERFPVRESVPGEEAGRDTLCGVERVLGDGESTGAIASFCSYQNTHVFRNRPLLLLNRTLPFVLPLLLCLGYAIPSARCSAQVTDPASGETITSVADCGAAETKEGAVVRGIKVNTERK